MSKRIHHSYDHLFKKAAPCVPFYQKPLVRVPFPPAPLHEKSTLQRILAGLLDAMGWFLLII
jgi:hypothetical protein